MTVTRHRLIEMLDYDPKTGEFWWKQSRRGVSTKKPAGHKGKNTTTTLQIDGAVYVASHLAWLYHHGEWPVDILDHKDRDIHNNRIDNLRPANDRSNQWNSKVRKHSKSGLKGVCLRSNGRAQAYITIDGRRTNLGVYETPEQAHDVYKAAASAHFGEFARGS